MSDLDKLVPQACEITLAGETVSVKPLKVGQMPAFLRAITPVMQQINGDGIDWLAVTCRPPAASSTLTVRVGALVSVKAGRGTFAPMGCTKPPLAKPCTLASVRPASPCAGADRLLMASKKPTPRRATASRLTTYSPGVSMAGTVSDRDSPPSL